MVTIALADDYAVVRQGLRLLLESNPEFVVVGEATNGIEALKLVRRMKPKVLIVDLAMPGMGGLETARKASRLKLDTRVVILTMYGDEPYLLDALGSGASGFLVKESCADDVFQAISEVAAGRYYLSPALFQDFSRRYLQKFRSTLLKLFPGLTIRQRKELQRALAKATRGGAGRGRSLAKKGPVPSSLRVWCEIGLSVLNNLLLGRARGSFSSGQSRRTTLRRELLIFSVPLYSMNPSLLNLFMK